jgi:hypothetical protein
LDEQEEPEDWLQAYLIADLRDVLVLVDLAPSLVFAGEAEDSLAERWIEAGNGIVWTGALPFAESIATDGSTMVWGPSAADGLLDALPGVCRGAGPELLQPIARYQLPSLTATSATNALCSTGSVPPGGPCASSPATQAKTRTRSSCATRAAACTRSPIASPAKVSRVRPSWRSSCASARAADSCGRASAHVARPGRARYPRAP